MPPKVLAARRGAMARDVSKVIISFRNVAENAISKAPAKEPRAKAGSVAPNALSMDFMVPATIPEPVYEGV